MFQGFQQRLQKNLNLDFLDNKIAEEQAKQQPPARGSSPAKRTTGSAGARRGTGQGTRPSGRPRSEDARDANLGPASKGPDPEEFVIGEDASDISRAATPHPSREGTDGSPKESEKVEERESSTVKGKEKVDPDMLPQDVRQKLAKLEILTARYQDLLRNYRAAHTHVAAIVPFEATLREHTPLTSISDPGALVEFLTQRSLQSEMVMTELKRVTNERQEIVMERDTLRLKLEEAEKMVKSAFDEAAGLRQARKEPEHAAARDSNKDDSAFFSYEQELSRVDADKEEHTAEFERLVQEVKAQTDRANELSAENMATKKELETAREKAETIKTELHQKEEELDKRRTDLSEAQSHLEKASKAEGEMRAQLLLKEKEISELSTHEVASSPSQEERMESTESVISTLKSQVSELEATKETRDAEVSTLQAKVARLEDDKSSLSRMVASLDSSDAMAENLKKRVSLLETELEEAGRIAKSRQGHEAKVASLRSQLTIALSDRDMAYRAIINCGKCEQPPNEAEEPPVDGNGTVQRSRSNSDLAGKNTSAGGPDAAPSTQDVPSIEGDGLLTPVDANKKGKKKRKSKAKKPSAVTSTPDDKVKYEDIAHDVQRMRELVQVPLSADATRLVLTELMDTFKKTADARDSEMARLDTLFNEMTDKKEQTIQDQEKTIQTKSRELEAREVYVQRLLAEAANGTSQREKMRGVVDELQVEVTKLQEDNAMLNESLLDLGQRVTDSANKLKQANDERVELQKAYDKLQEDCDGYKDMLNMADKIADELRLENTELKQQGSSDEEIKDAQEQLEKAQKEKESLQAAKEACERQIEELKEELTTSSQKSEASYLALVSEIQNFSSKSKELETELAAVNQLAQSRFRDLTELRVHHSKLQPELKRLRDESAELKTAKAELEKVGASAKRLEAKERDLRSEIAEYKSQSSAKDGEMMSLRERAKKSEERKAAMEEACDKARKDLEKSESVRTEVIEARDKAQGDVKRFDQELKMSGSRVEELEKQLKKFSDEASGLQDELRRVQDDVQMKTAQQQSAQSAMDSMRDQTRELSTQMREAREQNQSQEDELREVHRLLSERNQEQETMRRMLTEAERKADERVKEMRKQMELAIEERDRAEDESSSIRSKKAREIEELKSKIRDAEDRARRAGDQRQDIERRERELETQHQELRGQVTQAQERLAESQDMVTQLRETLDDSDRQSQQLERQKKELRDMLEKQETQLDKLKSSNRTMTEELQKHQAANKGRPVGGTSRSSRPSMESARVKSPASKPGSDPAKTGDGKDQQIDLVYLKNILLQYMEQRDRRHQLQLVPVFSTLLHFDQQEEQKMVAAISGK